MDPVNVWIAIGTVCGSTAAVAALVLTSQQMQIGRLNRRVNELERSEAECHKERLRLYGELGDEQHRRRQAEATVTGLKRSRQLLKERLRDKYGDRAGDEEGEWGEAP